MDPYILYLITTLVAGLVGAVLVFLAGYRWGAFAALQALTHDSPKWKAYFLALFPPAALAVTFYLEPTLEPFASRTFWALAAPAVIGACFRYNRESYATL